MKKGTGGALFGQSVALESLNSINQPTLVEPISDGSLHLSVPRKSSAFKCFLFSVGTHCAHIFLKFKCMVPMHVTEAQSYCSSNFTDRYSSACKQMTFHKFHVLCSDCIWRRSQSLLALHPCPSFPKPFDYSLTWTRFRVWRPCSFCIR